MASHYHQLRAFAHVARQGSFSAAARALSISQSALTQHISNLEREIGAALLIRSRQGTVLTATGREFFDLSDDILRLDQRIADKIESHRSLGAGHLRIIANAPQPALRMIKRFSASYPDVDVEFTLYDWTRAMELLLNNEVDVGFVTAPTLTDALFAREIEKARYVLYCPKEHAFANRTAVSLRDLLDQVLLLPESGSLTERVVGEAFAKAQLTCRKVVKTTTFPVMKEAILQGVGVGIFLERSASNEPRLSEIPITELPEPFTTYIVAPKSKVDYRSVQSLLTLD